MIRFACALVVSLLVGPLAGGAVRQSAAGSPDRLADRTFSLAAPSEMVATITAACPGCSWGRKGSESAALIVDVDGRYSQHVYLTRGAPAQPYRLSIGALETGTHTVTVRLDRAFSAAGVGPTAVSVDVAPVPEDERLALSMSPILYARPNTLGRFSDVPLLMWYEEETTATGSEIRYSVIFSNEDGGTPTDRLMATWGRPTDIEFIYAVELDASGRVTGGRYQGREHEILRFAGTRDGAHAKLWIVTDNNMVSDRGTTEQRYAPVPERVDLSGASREIVMDRHPWTYRVSAEEIAREGRVVAGGRPGSGTIPDPREFVYIEACGEMTDATLSFAVATVGTGGTLDWHESDGGQADFRIARSGCFRGAVAPSGPANRDRIAAIRFRAHIRPPRKGEAPLAPDSGSVRIRRVNRVFMLNADYTPGPSRFAWTGEILLTPAGKPGVLTF